MKKTKLLLIIFTCGLLAACGKEKQPDIEPTEWNDPGVEVIKESDDFDYSYKEQEDGSILFTIEGKWEKTQKWSITSDETAVATVKEGLQSNKKVEYHFVAKEEVGGYSEYSINLSDSETNKVSYKIMFSIISDIETNETPKLSVLNAYYYVPSEEEETEETTPEEGTEEDTEETTESEVYTQEDLDRIEQMSEEFWDVVGNISIPEEFTVVNKEASDYKGSKTGTFRFEYKDSNLGCLIAPSVSLSDIQSQFEEDVKTQKVGETEVYLYEVDNDTYVVWKSKAEVCYMLVGREVENDIVLEAVKLMLDSE